MPIITLGLCCNTSKPRGGSGSRRKHGVSSSLFSVVCPAEISSSQPALSHSLIRQSAIFLPFYFLLLFSGGGGGACWVLSITITAEQSEGPSVVELTL